MLFKSPVLVILSCLLIKSKLLVPIASESSPFLCVKESLFGNSKSGRLQVYNTDNSEPEELTREDLEPCKEVIRFKLDVPVKKIARDAFMDYTNLEYLEIDTNITRLERGQFDGLVKISTFVVSSPNLEYMDSEVFDDFNNIQAIVISGSPLLENIENEVFSSLPKLQRLDLKFNNIEEFEAPNILSNSDSLENLILRGNKLKHLTPETLRGLQKLALLDVSHNEIIQIDDNTFSENQNLRALYISHNNLKTIAPNVFGSSPMNNLKVFHISFNKLYYLSPFVLSNMPNLRSVRLLGNPWKCTCWNMILEWLNSKDLLEECHFEYMKGDIPTCVAPKPGDAQCTTLGQYDEYYSETFRTNYDEGTRC